MHVEKNFPKKNEVFKFIFVLLFLDNSNWIWMERTWQYEGGVSSSSYSLTLKDLHLEFGRKHFKVDTQNHNSTTGFSSSYFLAVHLASLCFNFINIQLQLWGNTGNNFSFSSVHFKTDNIINKYKITYYNNLYIFLIRSRKSW